MRDGHQSLLATRMRSVDMIRVAPAYASNLPSLFSVECWGGATFDVAYRFLQECPWQRLRDLRAQMPNLMTQMLLRASNGVGYTNYPDNVVRAFVKEASKGIDVFRVFDSLNWVENMRIAMDAVIDSGKICEGTICYTGDILNPDRSKYNLKYYVNMAKNLQEAGAHFLGLKDMAGSIVEALQNSERDTGINIENLREISDYWGQVRAQYAAFESGLSSPASEVYLHEMPGGQFTNLKAQARSMGMEEKWHDIAETYADVNQMFGDIVKVTPSSKVVGDMALMMVAQNLSRDDVENPKTDVAFPESVVDMLRGNLGQPPGGFPKHIVKKALKGEKPNLDRPGKNLEPIDLEKTRQELSEKLDGMKIDDEDLNGYLMYPKVFLDYMERHLTYGPVRTLPTKTFFYGMNSGDEISLEIDPGKTLEIRMQAIGETDENGEVKVFFELNGQPRVIRVPNRLVTSETTSRPKADPSNSNHIGAPMPGVISTVSVNEGQTVKKGDLLLTIEAMKMETGIHVERDAKIKAVHVKPATQIDAKDLIIELA